MSGIDGWRPVALARVGCVCFVAVLGCGRPVSNAGSDAGGATGLGGAISGSGGASSGSGGGIGGSSSGVGGAPGSGGSSGTGGDSSGVGGGAGADGAGTDGGTADSGDGGLAVPLQPLESLTASSMITSIAIDNGVIYVGGFFVGGTTQLTPAGVAAIDEVTLAIKPEWRPQIPPYVDDVIVSNGVVYTSLDIAGNGQGVSNLLALDAVTGSLMTPSYPLASAAVRALALGGDTLYFGGFFMSVGGVSRNHLGAIDATTGALTSWAPNDAVPSAGFPAALAINGNTVYLAGGFTLSNGANGTRKNLAAVDATTGAATTWNPAPDASVFTLSISGNTLFVGGVFTTIAGQSRNHAAAFELTTGALLPWNPDTDGPVRALDVHGGNVFLGGAFTTVGGQYHRDLAAVDAGSAAVIPWNPIVSLPLVPLPGDVFPNPGVTALAVSDRIVAVGGNVPNTAGARLDFFTPPP
jgi:hypothetical protein